MKKRILSLCLPLILAVLCMPGIARAAAQVDVLITATPDNLLSAGYVTLNVSVSLTSLTSSRIDDVSLYMTGGSTPLATWQSVSADSPLNDTVPNILISEPQIGSTLPLELRYVEEGVHKIVYTGVSVFRGVPQTVYEANVRFTREASAQSAAFATPVTLTYWIGNTGSLPMYDVAVQDPIIGMVGVKSHLNPGESITFNSILSMKETAVSTPVLTYRTQQGGEAASITLDPLTIVLAEAKLTVTLDADVTEIRAGEAVRLTYNIINEGNIAFTNLQISDDSGSMIPGRDELPPGGSYIYTRKENLVKPGEFFFEVTAIDAMGESVQIKSNAVSVNVIDVVLETSQPVQEVLSVSVEPSLTRLAEPGEVTFTITVSNRGDEPVLGLVLSESSVADGFEKMDQLSGDKTFKYKVTVTEQRTFTFTAQGRLASDRRVQAVSAPIEILLDAQEAQVTPPPWEVSPSPSASPAVSAASAQPEETSPAIPSTGGSRSSLLLTALLVVVALILLCVAALIITTRRSRSRAYEAEAYGDYDAEEPYYEQEEAAEHYDDSYDYSPTQPVKPAFDDENEVTRPVDRPPPSAGDVPTRPVKRD